MNRTKLVLLAAFVSLALAFTFSCSSGGDGDGTQTSSSSSDDDDGGGSSSSCNDCGDDKKDNDDDNDNEVGSSGPCPDAETVDATGTEDGSVGSVTCGGKTYKTVKIGTQTWMAENLNYNASGSKCYKNLKSNCDTYGRLYNWATAMDIAETYNSIDYTTEGEHQGICPSGWHIPGGGGEWITLLEYVDPNWHSIDLEGNVPGTKLKATSGWKAHATYGNGTDDYGFSALPGGIGNSDGYFFDVGEKGYWWLSGGFHGSYAGSMSMKYDGSDVDQDGTNRSMLLSVRCVKNSN